MVTILTKKLVKRIVFYLLVTISMNIVCNCWVFCWWFLPYLIFYQHDFISKLIIILLCLHCFDWLDQSIFSLFQLLKSIIYIFKTIPNRCKIYKGKWIIVDLLFTIKTKIFYQYWFCAVGMLFNILFLISKLSNQNSYS